VREQFSRREKQLSSFVDQIIPSVKIQLRICMKKQFFAFVADAAVRYNSNSIEAEP
jgi:hypothetical protein